MDRDGALSLEEFLLWWTSEGAALLPLVGWRCLYWGNHRLIPLYNRFVRVATRTEPKRPGGSGVGGGGGGWDFDGSTRAGGGGGGSRAHGWEEASKRRQAPGLTVRQLVDMLQAAGVVGGCLADDREVRGAAKLALQGVRAERARAERVQGQMEGANHLSWPLFVRTLIITAGKGMGLPQLLLRLVCEGAAAPLRGLPPPPPPGEDNELLDNVFMGSDVEGELFEMEEEVPGQAGERQRVWLLSNPDAMKGLLDKARVVLKRRLRGSALPPRFSPHAAASRVCCRNVRAAFHRYCARWNKVGRPAWMRLCGDMATLSAALTHSGSGLTPHRLEAVFTYCASIAGVYLQDDSPGVHDMPVPPPRSGRGASMAVGRAAAEVAGGLPRGRATHSGSAAGRYGATVKGLESMRRSLPVAPRGALRLSSAWAPAAASAAAEAAAAGREADSPPSSPNGAAGHHRPPVLSLTFVQFLEALRLAAEELVGHPVTNDEVDAVLLSILADICARPAPQPDGTSMASPAGGGGSSPLGYPLSRPRSAPPPRY
ncbi:hypothetical protein GPECTOR_25g312 [Gonium pectorale]|uniref:EF-hand domain-containing protein n=1 Tax=Gonium pectorale TaxID=33097 RepID=A0A150GFW3_GONPE|nr:hypothetical protein GPECTOR_25g312 [Gonium pectorale]|eukprot:KXZ48728.1 hypothetical protein GPECTOR_25g312 [Gonium pectorale]